MMPINIQKAVTPDNFDRLLVNYNRKAPDKGWEPYWPTMPGNTFEQPGYRGQERTKRLTPEEYQRFLEVRGAYFMTMAASTPWNFDDPSLADRYKMEKLMRTAGERAKKDIILERNLSPAMKTVKQVKDAEMVQRATRIRDVFNRRTFENPSSTERPRY
jgi:hypothetical protein